jgi:phosphoglycolate phosphatase-like HAD superfamily hydrolase
MDKRPKTVICDIDGTLVEHFPPWITSSSKHEMKLLPGVIETLSSWDRLGYIIVLITGRKECLREVTENQLREAGIFYDKLIMGIGSGERVLINDEKPDGQIMSKAISLKRNEGIGNIKI